jgi:hypothetical protein
MLEVLKVTIVNDKIKELNECTLHISKEIEKGCNLILNHLKDIRELNDIDANICYFDRMEIFLTKIAENVNKGQSLLFIERDSYTNFEIIKMNVEKALQHSNESINKYKDEMNTRILSSEGKKESNDKHEEVENAESHEGNKTHNENALIKELKDLQNDKEKLIIEMQNLTKDYEDINIAYRKEEKSYLLRLECDKKDYMRNIYAMISLIVILIFIYYNK